MAAVRAIDDRIIAVVEQTPDDRLIECPFGLVLAMTGRDALPSGFSVL